MVRPLTPINWDTVLKMKKEGCSAKQIAKEIKINIDTFYDRFKREFNKSFQDFHHE